MEKKIEDYLHLYLGCDVKSKRMGIIFPLTTVTTNTPNIFKYGEYTLLLRPLSDIQIEEAANCVTQVFCPRNNYPLKDFRLTKNEYGNPVCRLNNDWFDESLTFGTKTGAIWSARDKHLANTKIPSSIFVYLLKQGFDLFGLIESGLAIDKTKLEDERKATL